MRLRLLQLGLLAGLLLAGCTQTDTTKPTITFSAPADNSTVNSSSVTVQGTAKDDKAVNKLTYQLNGGAEQTVSITAGATVNFSIPVSSLVEGSNTVVVNAYDAAGNKGTASLKLNFSLFKVIGTVNESTASGGKPMVNAKVTVKLGAGSASATTGADGKFTVAVETSDTVQTTAIVSSFSITVEPPADKVAAGYFPLTYDAVPIADYNSGFGAAKEMNIYMPGGAAVTLGGYPAKFGCVKGTLFDTDGTTPVVAAPPTGRTGRVSPASCTSTNPTQLFTDTTPLNPGENGLVLWGGLRAVTTLAGGAYRIPLVSTNLPFAASGSMWAGNYTGTDTGNPNTAFEYYWSKFAFLPNVNIFTNPNGAEVTQNLTLQAFDPATNPSKVATVSISHDTSAFAADGFNTATGDFSASLPSFGAGITSAEVELGQYYFINASPRNMRVYKIPSGAPGQQIAIFSPALHFDPTGTTVISRSHVFQWRDGTNLTSALSAKFIATGKPTEPASAATGVSRTPTLKWKAVPEAKVYVVTIFDPGTGKGLWRVYTPNTQATVPVSLAASKGHAWQVYTDDQTAMLDYIGSDPDALDAHLWLAPGRLARKNLQSDAINDWRGEIVQGYLKAQGRIPSRFSQREGAYQNLLTNGYRESLSETATFTTGN